MTMERDSDLTAEADLPSELPAAPQINVNIENTTAPDAAEPAVEDEGEPEKQDQQTG